MYLFVSIFLMLSAMGLFTELYLIQAMQLWSEQKTVAEIMNEWHMGAYVLAKEMPKDVITPNCRISPNDLPDGVGPCGAQLADPAGGLCAGCTRHYLPVGYQYKELSMQFPSVVYKDGDTTFLATYVPPPEDGATETTAWLGYTASEILVQMRNTGAPAISYGQVIDGTCLGLGAGHWFSTSMYQTHEGTTTQICYPALASIPKGSVGFISLL